MSIEGSPARRFALLWLLPLGTLVVMALTSAWVGTLQARYQHRLVQRHAEDICHQAARRLQVLVDAQLAVSALFARYWAGEERAERTGEDFREFAEPLAASLSGYHALGMFDASRRPVWIVEESEGALASYMDARGRPLFELAVADAAVVSDPVAFGSDAMSFVAVHRIPGAPGPSAFLVSVFEVDELVRDAFEGAIGEEFHYILEDRAADIALYQIGNQPAAGSDAGAVVAAESFPVANRTWHLQVSPRSGGRPDGSMRLVLLGFGALLSIGLAVLVALLTRRMVDLERSRAWHRDAEQRRAELARKVLRVQEEERARLSRELHDELGQLLTGVRVELDVVRRGVGSGSGAAVELDDTYRLVGMALDAVRQLCRGLRPPALDDLGLVPAIRQLVSEFASRHGIDVELEVARDLETLALSEEAGVTYYRVLQEALTNVGRHAGAARVRVSLRRDGDRLLLDIDDDGRGFDPDDLAGREGVGLVGMRERARLIGGDVEIRAAADRGTRVTLGAPFARTGAEERA